VNSFHSLKLVIDKTKNGKENEDSCGTVCPILSLQNSPTHQEKWGHLEVFQMSAQLGCRCWSFLQWRLEGQNSAICVRHERGNNWR
jgi:hypothetical protein